MTIKIENISYTYQSDTIFSQSALHDITTKAYAGETIGIAGYTGSGKSTLIQMIAGLMLPDHGVIEVGDLRIYGYAKIKARDLAWRISFVFQNSSAQIFAETVEEEIGFTLKNLGWKPEQIKERVNEVIAEVGLTPDYLPRNPLLLSGGEKRRVALAGALVSKAPVIILDEPTSALDRSGREDLKNLIENLQNDGDKIIIIVSHDMDFLAETCNRMWLMSAGEIIKDAKIEEAFNDAIAVEKSGIKLPTVLELAEKLRLCGYDIDLKSTKLAEAMPEIIAGLRGEKNEKKG